MINNSNDLSLITSYVLRNRVYNLFEQASAHKLVYVIAGAGYGKTQAAYHYIKQQNAIVWWVQLTDSDNISSRFWENYVHVVYSNYPEMATTLREFGFPETMARFKQFAEIIRKIENKSQKIFLVFDDFHLIQSKEVLDFIERCAYLQILGVCIIILSRNEPDINAVSLLSKGKVHIIIEDELLFTSAETEAFFLQQTIAVSQQEILLILEKTKGWPLAINMLATILKKTPKNLKYALDTMMQNILKLLEHEAWNDFPIRIQKILVKLSLLSNLPAASMQELSNEVVTEMKYSQNGSGLASFIWFSGLTNDIKIHPLYLEFLLSKQHILSCEEKKETYQMAAKWCNDNGFYLDAINYYAKLNEFDVMVKMLFSYPFNFPRDTSEYFFNIIENLRQDDKGQQYPALLFLKNFFTPLLLAGMGKYEEATSRALAVIEEWENVDDSLAYVFLYTSYSTLAYIDMYTCTYTHKYKGPAYLKKSVEYSKLTSITPAETTVAFVNADIRSFACTVGQGAALHELDEFMDAARQTALYIEETHYKVYAGYDDLVACECAYFKNQAELARNHAHKAITKAQENNQYSIAAMAENYLLRIAMQEGNILLVKEILKRMRSYLDNSNFSNRQLYYDLYIGAFYARIGIPEKVPQWLVMNEYEAAPGIRIPARELIVSSLYNLSVQNYHQLLTLLCNSYPRKKHERFLFGELQFLLFSAIARIKTGDSQGAIENFEDAYNMSFEGVLEMTFIERGKELHPLVVAALKQTTCKIPKEWLKAIDRRATIYEKKIAIVMSAFRNEHKVQLSHREMEILRDMYHGLSQEEMASNQHLSINTVKKVLQSIYLKLGANSNIDAIRIAIEKKLIK